MDCMLCKEPITNPLCPDCLTQAVEQWLGTVAPDRAEALKNAIAHPDSDTGAKCIRCNKHFNLCTYCYSKEVFNWLRYGELQMQFMHIFPFMT